MQLQTTRQSHQRVFRLLRFECLVRWLRRAIHPMQRLTRRPRLRASESESDAGLPLPRRPGRGPAAFSHSSALHSAHRARAAAGPPH